MINFDEEITKYQYILTIDDVSKKVEDETNKDDVIGLLEYIAKKVSGKDNNTL